MQNSIIYVAYLVFFFISQEGSGEDTHSRSITSPQFCGGCKVTVEIMGNLASRGLKGMERAKIDRRKTLDISALSIDLCSRIEFSNYKPFVEDSCIKIMNDHKHHFLNVFAGEKSTLFSSIRGNLFKAKRAACVNETRACPSQLFSTALPHPVERTKCNACFEIAKDIEAAKFVLKQPSNNAVIIEDICAHIPSNHMPYAWIESFCDEIMDDFADDIIAELQRRDALQQDPFAAPVSQLVCRDMLGCGPPPWEQYSTEL